MLRVQQGAILSGRCAGAGSEGSVKKGELGESATEGDIDDWAVSGFEFFLSGLNSE